MFVKISGDLLARWSCCPLSAHQVPVFSPTYKSMQTCSLGFSFLVLIFVSLCLTYYLL